MNRKLVGYCPFREGGELRPQLTQRRLGQGLPRTKRQHDPSSRLAAIDMGRKLGGMDVPFFLG